MIASSTTVLSNLAYLIGAVVLAIVVGMLVWLRHRQPKSVDANMRSFQRGLSALAPDAPGQGRPPEAARPVEPARIRPIPAGQTHVRLETRDPSQVPSGGDTEGDGSG